MYTLREYIKAKTPEEAAQLLRADPRNTIIGGNMWLRTGSRAFHTGIDLCDLELDQIEYRGELVSLGAMTSLSALRKNEILAEVTHGAFERCVAPIVGTQFQNMATIGGSLYARFGFSDVNTLLLALDATADFVIAGSEKVEDFLARGPQNGRDVLTHIFIPAHWTKVSFSDFRNTSTDLSVLNCACAANGVDFRIAVGARPGRCELCRAASDAWKAGKAPEEIAAVAADELTFGSNARASASYRKILCEQLVMQCIKEADVC